MSVIRNSIFRYAMQGARRAEIETVQISTARLRAPRNAALRSKY